MHCEHCHRELDSLDEVEAVTDEEHRCPHCCQPLDQNDLDAFGSSVTNSFWERWTPPPVGEFIERWLPLLIVALVLLLVLALAAGIVFKSHS